MSMICTKCGAEYADGKFCVKCGGALVEKGNAPQPQNDNGMGTVYVYRMGSPMGMALPMSVYIDGNPAAQIANKGTAKIVLPYGTHNMHIALAMNRNCNDLAFTLSPQNNVIYTKARLITGAWKNRIEIIQCAEGEIPIP